MPKFWFDHVHLSGLNPPATADYYVKMFGARKVETRDIGGGRTLVALDLNGTRLVVTTTSPMQVTTDDGKTITVFEQYGLRTDNIEEAVAELKKAGVKFVREITPGGKGLKFSHFITSDNVLVELLERPK
ncbi:MAG: VOC family protein [Dehalococcoidales bacterium]|nr:VOC family protein [Dehalococcoidales bacterium]